MPGLPFSQHCWVPFAAPQLEDSYFLGTALAQNSHCLSIHAAFSRLSFEALDCLTESHLTMKGASDLCVSKWGASRICDVILVTQLGQQGW